MLPNTSAASVEGTPSLLTAQPSEGFAHFVVHFKFTTSYYCSGAIEEEVNWISWYSPSDRVRTKHSLRAYVGTMIASEFVKEKPIKPWSDAILA